MKSETHEDIDLKELFVITWNYRNFVLLVTLIFTFAFLAYAVSLPNIYTSKAVLIPTNQKETLSSKINNYSTIASFAGVSIDENSTKSDEAIKRIKSFQFFSEHFLPNVDLQDILAVKKWLPNTNSTIYDKKIFDEENNIWNTKNNLIPSKQTAYKAYSDFIKVTEDDKSFVTLSFDHKSPYIAKEWVEIVIKNINESMRLESMNSAKKSIDFLNATSNTTNVQSLNLAISKLLETQMQTLMLSSSDDYVYKVIDSPIVSEFKSGPKRPLIVIFGMLFGFIASVGMVLIRHFKKTISN